jgi:hypothetical protein
MDLRIRKNKKSYTIYDMYNAYHNEAVDVPYSRFKRILDEFNKTIKDEVLESSGSFKMPLGLGYVCIVKYKPKSYTAKSLSKDYKSSKEEGKTIYHLNEHSNGYKYRLYWSKIPRTFPARYKYQLLMVRENKRHLAQLIFNKHDYINVDDIQIYKM